MSARGNLPNDKMLIGMSVSRALKKCAVIRQLLLIVH